MAQELYVNSQLVDCEGVGPQKCLQVRTSPEAQWELFYGHIEGFTFEPGHHYRLLVDVTRAENVPADASSVRYSLIEVVEKRPD